MSFTKRSCFMSMERRVSTGFPSAIRFIKAPRFGPSAFSTSNRRRFGLRNGAQVLSGSNGVIRVTLSHQADVLQVADNGAHLQAIARIFSGVTLLHELGRQLLIPSDHGQRSLTPRSQSSSPKTESSRWAWRTESSWSSAGPEVAIHRSEHRLISVLIRINRIKVRSLSRILLLHIHHTSQIIQRKVHQYRIFHVIGSIRRP